MSTQSHKEKDQTTITGSGDACRLRHSVQSNSFAAFDIRSPFFTNKPDHQVELAKVYMRVFNSVDVSKKWTMPRAQNMVDLHARTLGCNLALFDLEEQKVIGGFLSTIVPSAKGWRLSSQDIFLDPKYWGSGLFPDLYAHSLAEADQICLREKGAPIVADSSTTYKKPPFPRDMWAGKGYTLRALFILAAQDISQHEPNSSAKITIEHGQLDDIEKIAFFISQGSTVSSDGEKWGEQQALAYTKFMLDNHRATFAISKRGREIVAVSSLNIIPGRYGPTGVEAQCFVTNNTDEVGHNDIVHSAFDCLLRYAQGASMQSWGEKFSAIEIPEASAAFFGKVFSDMRESDEYLSVHGDQQVLTNSFPQPGHQSRINLIAHMSKERETRHGR